MSSSRRFVVAINPQAAFGKHAHIGDAVTARLEAEGFSFTTVRGRDFHDARERVIAALTEHDARLGVGGEGRVSMAVNIVAETGIPFAVMPAGTGNDFARGLGMPVDQEEVVSIVAVANPSCPSGLVDANATGDCASGVEAEAVISVGQ